MGVRNVVGFTNSVSTLRRPNPSVRTVVQLARRWRFAPRAEARSQFNQAAKGGRFRPSRGRVATLRACVNNYREQGCLRHAPALRHGAAPTLPAHHRQHRRRGAHAFPLLACVSVHEQARIRTLPRTRCFSRTISSAAAGQDLLAFRPECSLTPRSSGAPTAGHQGPVRGTVYIFSARALASCRRHSLTSNVRRHNQCPGLESASHQTPAVISLRCTGS